MDNDELMTIGRFARLSGVSVHTLRHYDEVGLLAPAEVDETSGYRRYRQRQIHHARLIRALRWTDLPIEEIRQILVTDTDEDAQLILAGHRRRLERQLDHLSVKLRDVIRFQENGITMPAVQSGCRPVQIRLKVKDREAAVAFYQKAFDLRYDVIRRTEKKDYSSFMFGTYGQDDFFLLHMNDEPDRVDLAGPANIGFLVPDVDTYHAKALAAGAIEVHGPHDPEGMPRTSTVTDPDGTWIGLFEGGSGCRPVQLMLTVSDANAATTFYQKAFGLRHEVTRRMSDENHSSFIFGNYGQDDFYLLWLLDDPDRVDRLGPMNFSLLVEDVDAYHARALEAGATELSPPRQAEGMPRGSAIKDPDGNWIGLAQG